MYAKVILHSKNMLIQGQGYLTRHGQTFQNIVQGLPSQHSNGSMDGDLSSI